MRLDNVLGFGFCISFIPVCGNKIHLIRLVLPPVAFDPDGSSAVGLTTVRLSRTDFLAFTAAPFDGPRLALPLCLLRRSFLDLTVCPSHCRADQGPIQQKEFGLRAGIFCALDDGGMVVKLPSSV